MKKSVAVRRPLPTSPFKARIQAPLRQFAPGDRVTHDRFGLGRAIRVESDGAVLFQAGWAMACRGVWVRSGDVTAA
ncbi:hypothetical protein [Streptacidiphilus sp. MAP12-33]|uniref:hypothetical protein n=1 Tax=Streptacidiphilus sp. MAP12-33 TaxID=3156266 RepID=UPI00351779F7